MTSLILLLSIYYVAQLFSPMYELFNFVIFFSYLKNDNVLQQI